MQTLKRVKMATARAWVTRLFTVLGEGQRRLDESRVEAVRWWSK